MKYFQSINPHTATLEASFPIISDEEWKRKVDLAHQSQLAWKRVGISKRAGFLLTLAQILKKNKNDYAYLMAIEMGKPLTQGYSEIDKCAWLCEYYAEEGEKMLADEIVRTAAEISKVVFEPLGVIFSIMPWNFPFWQVFRFAVPSLLAGNAVLLKHAPNVPQCAMAIEELFREANFAENIFQNLIIDTDQAKEVIHHDKVRAVTFTGSTEAGRKVAMQAGMAIKKCVLELGGSDPFIVLEDADIALAAQTAAKSRLLNSGQSCISAKRFILIESIAEAFLAELKEHIAHKIMGDPTQEKSELGPLARQDLKDILDLQVEKSLAAGAICKYEGEILSDSGWYVPPTILDKVSKGMPAYQEELFGPVAAVMRAQDEKEAIALANDTSFGLGAAIFTQDILKGERIATEELAAGCCVVNSLVVSDPRLPFGGIKESGYGRELSHYGIKEFVNIKSVSVFT